MTLSRANLQLGDRKVTLNHLGINFSSLTPVVVITADLSSWFAAEHDSIWLEGTCMEKKTLPEMKSEGNYITLLER